MQINISEQTASTVIKALKAEIAGDRLKLHEIDKLKTERSMLYDREAIVTALEAAKEALEIFEEFVEIERGRA